MKTMTAAIAIAGCAAGWSACAGQIDTPVLQARFMPVGSMPATALLGVYPGNREASGTSWQPDSTPVDRATATYGAAEDVNVFAGSRNPRFSLLGNGTDTTLSLHHKLGAGIVGLQSSFSFDPSTSMAAYPPAGVDPSRQNPVFAGSGFGSAIRRFGLAASYSLPVGAKSSLFGYFGMPGEPALGPPVSYMRRFSGIDAPDVTQASHWMDSTSSGGQVFTLGYTWRDLRLEGSAFSRRDLDRTEQAEKEPFKLDSTSTRLSFNPSQNWSFQFSRGSISGLDQLEPDEDIHRTTISTTYNRAFSDGTWQTTLAWGRNARKSREPTMGFLLESTLRFSGTHAVFGRLEQVGSDETVRESESLQRQMLKLNRLTIGYFHDFGPRGPVSFDAGVFASRYFVPSNSVSSYGSEPTSFMLFIRFKLQ